MQLHLRRDGTDLETPHMDLVLVKPTDTFDAQDKAQEKQSLAQDLGYA